MKPLLLPPKTWVTGGGVSFLLFSQVDSHLHSSEPCFWMYFFNHQRPHGMNMKLCPGPFFHHFPGSLQHLASCWQSSVLWQCRSKPSKSKKSNSNLCPTCRPRSSRCKSNYKVFSRGTRWRCSGGKMRRNVRTNFCRLSWMKYRSGWNIEILLWTLKIRRSWTRTYMSAPM